MGVKLVCRCIDIWLGCYADRKRFVGGVIRLKGKTVSSRSEPHRGETARIMEKTCMSSSGLARSHPR